MKADIHPTYFPEARVTCACGNTFVTGSTKPEIRVDICSNCHPFFTGEEKFVDTEGRVERFKRQETKATERREHLKKAASEKAAKKEAQKEPERPLTLKEMLQKIQES